MVAALIRSRLHLFTDGFYYPNICKRAYFEKPAALSAKKFARGTFHTKTIFLEKNPDLIAKIQEMMKYDYAGEPDETESFEEGIPEVSESPE